MTDAEFKVLARNQAHASAIIRRLATALETAIGRLSSVAKDDDEIAEVESLTNTLDEAIREWG